MILDLLADNHAVGAVELCEAIGWDKPAFKAHVRRLKELGLTVSLPRGYELPPRLGTAPARPDRMTSHDRMAGATHRSTAATVCR